MVTLQQPYPHFEKDSPSGQYQQINHYCVDQLEGLLIKLMYMDIPENLEKPQSSYQSLQQDLIKHERTVRHAFQFQLEKLFQDFKHIRRTRLHANQSNDWLSIGLTGQNSSKLQKQLETISDNHHSKFDSLLLTEGKRLKKLVHRHDESQGDNPLIPLNICTAFLAAIETLNLTSLKTCQMLELFSLKLDQELGVFYKSIDLGLFNLGILPELSDPLWFSEEEQDVTETQDIKNHETVAEPETSELEDETEASNILYINQSLKTFSKAKDNQQALKAAFKTFKQETEQGKYDLDDRISQLEHQLSELIPKSRQKEVSKFNLYFTRLLKNPLLSKALIQQLSRIASPLIQLVLADPFFFRSSSHPVNDFIQSIVDYEIRLKFEEKSLFLLEKLFDQILIIDNPVLSDYQPIAESFEAFKLQQNQLREQQKKQQQELDEILKQEILNIINEATSTLLVGQETLSFFYEDWYLLILQIARKIGKESAEFDQSIEIMKMLAWSLNEIKSDAPEHYKINSFTHLLRAIDKGLRSLHYPSQHRHRMRKQLIKEFRKNNKPGEIKVAHIDRDKTEPNSSLSLNVFMNHTKHPVLRKDPSNQAASTKHQQQAQSLEIGSWIEINTKNKARLQRAKLKWKSSDGQQFIFIDQRGHKLKELVLDELAQALASSEIKVLAGASISTQKKSSLGAGFDCYSND